MYRLLKSYCESMDLNQVTCLDIGTGTGVSYCVTHLGMAFGWD